MNFYHIEVYKKEDGWTPKETRIRTGMEHGEVFSVPTVYIGYVPPANLAKYHKHCTGQNARTQICDQPPEDYPKDALVQVYGGQAGKRLRADIERADKEAKKRAAPDPWETG